MPPSIVIALIALLVHAHKAALFQLFLTRSVMLIAHSGGCYKENAFLCDKKAAAMWNWSVLDGEKYFWNKQAQRFSYKVNDI